MVHSLEIYPKRFSFAIVYFCNFFKTLEIASLNIKKAYMWRFTIYFWYKNSIIDVWLSTKYASDTFVNIIII